VREVAISYDGSQIMSKSETQIVIVWDRFTGECKKSLSMGNDFKNNTCLFHDGIRFLSMAADKKIKVWDAMSERCEPTKLSYSHDPHKMSVMKILKITSDE
jgi:WD40 repeat protein